MRVVTLRESDIKSISRKGGEIRLIIRTARKARAIENAYQRNGAILASLQENNPNKYLYSIFETIDGARYCCVKLR